MNFEFPSSQHQLLFKMHYMYLIIQLTYSQFLILLNKVMVSILITPTWRWLTSLTYKLMLVAKRRMACIILTTPLAHYHPSSLIYYNFSMEVMPWYLKRILMCGMLALDTSTMTLFRRFIHPKWCTNFLISISHVHLYTWKALPQTFSLSSYSSCHIHSRVSACGIMWSNVTHKSRV